MTYTVPHFREIDIGTGNLRDQISLERFALNTGLGSKQALLSYSAGVEHALSMLSEVEDRKTFLAIAKILALREMQKGGIGRRKPIGWDDIANLDQLQKGLK